MGTAARMFLRDLSRHGLTKLGTGPNGALSDADLEDGLPAIYGDYPRTDRS